MGQAKALAGFASILGAASDFLKPAVTEIQTRRGEADALAAVQSGGPSWAVQSQEAADKGTVPTLPGQPPFEQQFGPYQPPVQGPTLPAAPYRDQNPQTRPAPRPVGAAALPTVAPSATPTPVLLPGLTGMGERTPGYVRNKGLSDSYMMTLSGVVMSALGPGWDVKIKSGGQMASRDPALKDQPGGWTGSHRHDVDHTGKSNTSDFVLRYQDQDVLPGQNKEAYAKLFRAAAPYFSGMGHYPWGAHIGDGPEAFWGPTKSAASADPYFLAAVQEGRAAAGRKYGQTRVEFPPQPDFDLVQTNQATFERRIPFTIRDAAFNEAADRLVGARARQALYSGASIAALEAGNDLQALEANMQALRSQIMGGLPASMTGLQLDLAEEFETTRGVAQRQAIGRIEAQVVQGQTDALNETVSAAQEQAQWLALSGASTQEIQGHMLRTQTAIARFGPREAFTFNGIEYPADNSRAGIMTPSDMSARLRTMGESAAEMMIRGDFERSTAKGAFVSEMRQEIFAGRSPLPPAKALQLLGQLEAGVRAEEARKAAAAREAAATLGRHTETTINPYVEMTEAGVPVAIPQEQRAQILADLDGYPELQRQAEIEFALADAAVATHGMTGAELSGYIGSQREQLQAAADRGEIDREGTQVILALEDKLKKLQAGITADMTGVTQIMDQTLSGVVADEIDFEGMRALAAGKADILEKIAVAETVFDQIAGMRNLNAAQREDALQVIRDNLADLAAMGDGYGKEGVFIETVLDKLEDWNTGLTELAGSDAKKFAAAKGIELAPLDGETPGALAGQVAQRVLDVSLAAKGEGVDGPVPLDAREKAMLKGLLDDTDISVSGRIEFLEGLAALPFEQSTAVLEALGGDGMYAIAGSMARMGRSADAEVMLFGTDSDLTIPPKIDRHTIRNEVAGPQIAAGYFADGFLSHAEKIAEHYAIGFAARSNKPEVEDEHMRMGYQVAFGMDSATGAGGVYDSNFGPVILPDKWTPKVFTDALYAGRNGDMMAVALGGQPFDAYGEEVPFSEFLGQIDMLRPVPGSQYKFYPADEFGNTFTYDDGSTVELDAARLWALRRPQ